jgi:hypothetical protein
MTGQAAQHGGQGRRHARSPRGRNKARTLAVKIVAAALALSQLQLEAGYNKPEKIKAAWSEALNEIAAVRAAGCS